ncbi:hypothetical protein GCM10009850_010650 [Nonomuraea monospora]|uniref:WD40 repeat protein n=1 Tax=Nonomuraea monospora TaxID=568818 RepID=A0ABN3C8H3_9ACTN
MGGSHRALSVGVPDARGMPALPFDGDLLDELSAALRAIGYTCESHLGLPSADLGATVRRSFGDEGVRLVHVIGHGRESRTDALFMLGSDGEQHRDSDVSQWLSELENLPGDSRTLLLIDLCHSGRMARLPWQLRHLDGTSRTWVLAACAQEERAYDGRFTRAFVTVLKALAAGELGVDPSVRYVPLQTVGRAVLREVNRLRGKGYRQHVTGSVIDLLTDPDLPFFPNPRYRPEGEGVRLREALDSGTVPFLDEGIDPGALPGLDSGLDERHFADRASGGSLSGALVGSFTGRKEQVTTLSAWIDGHGGGRLMVVTGSAGSGKSALLGVMVCAAHHALNTVTRPLWERAFRAPGVVGERCFAAVHARERGLPEIVASLARQLGLPAATGPRELLAALPADPPRLPVIVIDALDEARDGPGVQDELVLPLAASGLVRLVVGVRKYREYEVLRQAGLVVDLDEVEPDVLENDLHGYVTHLLRGTPRYRGRGSVVGGFADNVARALTRDGVRHDWGEFLVARIYTRSFAEGPEEVTDPREAERLGAAVPLTLPKVFEHDLAGGSPELRTVLHVLAHAHGDGMPVSVLARIAGLADRQDDVRRALEAGGFYLRRSVDSDGMSLYRLFHQGLADHLKNRTIPAGEVLDRLLGEPGGERWQAAEPYVLRHVAQHARDARRLAELAQEPGFLVRAAPAVLDQLAVHLPAGVLRDLRLTAGEPLPARLGVLALARLRAGQEPPAEGMRWRPSWTRAVRSHVTLPSRIERVAALTAPGATAVRSMAAVEKDGAALVVSGHDSGVIRVWNPSTGRLVHEFTGHVGAVNTLLPVEIDGAAIVASGGADDTLRLWNLDTLRPYRYFNRPRDISGGATPALMAMALIGRDTLITGGRARPLQLWNLPRSCFERDHPLKTGQDVLGLAVAGTEQDAMLAVMHGDGSVVTTQSRAVVGARAIVAAVVRGVPVVLVGDADGQVLVLTLFWLDPFSSPLRCHTGEVHAMAVANRPNGHILVTGGTDGRLCVVDLPSWRVLTTVSPTHFGGVNAVTVTSVAGELTAVSGGDRGELHVWRVAVSPTAAMPEPVLVPAGRDWRLIAEGALISPDTGAHLADAPDGWESATAYPLLGRTWWVLRQAGEDVLWDPETGTVTGPVTLPFPAQPPRPTLHVCDGELAEVRMETDHAVAVHAVPSGRRLRPELVHDRPVTAVAVAEVGGRATLFTGGDDGRVRIVDVAGWQVTDSLHVGAPVRTLLASSGGHLVVTTGEHEAIGFLWEGRK